MNNLKCPNCESVALGYFQRITKVYKLKCRVCDTKLRPAIAPFLGLTVSLIMFYMLLAIISVLNIDYVLTIYFVSLVITASFLPMEVADE